jgi:hypothetical protein
MGQVTLQVVSTIRRDASATLASLDGFLASCLLCRHVDIAKQTFRVLDSTFGTLPDVTYPDRVQRALEQTHLEGMLEAPCLELPSEPASAYVSNELSLSDRGSIF